MVYLSSTRTARSLSAELLSIRSAPYCCMALFVPKGNQSNKTYKTDFSHLVYTMKEL